MAAFNKFDAFVEALAEKVHNLGTDTLKVYLTNDTPSGSGDAVKAGQVLIVLDDREIREQTAAAEAQFKLLRARAPLLARGDDRFGGVMRAAFELARQRSAGADPVALFIANNPTAYTVQLPRGASLGEELTRVSEPSAATSTVPWAAGEKSDATIGSPSASVSTQLP